MGCADEVVEGRGTISFPSGYQTATFEVFVINDDKVSALRRSISEDNGVIGLRSSAEGSIKYAGDDHKFFQSGGRSSGGWPLPGRPAFPNN